MKKSTIKFFTPDELNRFIAACPPWLAAFAEFGSITGLRPGEIRRLERGNVNYHANMFHEGQELGLISLRADQTKTKRDETVLLLPRAREILQALPASIPFMFQNGKGNPITASSLRHHFTKAGKKAGLAVARPHMLRHTCASWLLQRGVPLAMVQHILRHKHQTTTEVYTHILPVHLIGAMSALMDGGSEVDQIRHSEAI